MPRLTIPLCLFLGALASPELSADVTLPALFSDHMVVQAGVPVAVWGWAGDGENVSVALGGHTARTTPGAGGEWLVRLAPLPASAQPQTLTVRGRNFLTVGDVLVGEVWLCSGQSNMEMQLKGLHGAVDNADAEIAAASHPTIRMFQHDEVYDIYQLRIPPAAPQRDRPGRWIVCSPATAAHFTALGYFFARELQQTLSVPIGLVHSSVGGTPIEAWTSREAQAAVPELQPMLADWKKRLTGYDPAAEQQANLASRKKWQQQAAAAKAAGAAPPKAPAAFKNLQVSTPSGLFHAMIAPLIPYTIRGVLWYQGERNAAGPFTGLYGLQLKTMIADWRARWHDEFYFAYAQLPNFQKEQKAPSEPNGWGVSVREGQWRTTSVPHTGMAITIDLANATAGHPTNKQAFSHRLALLALHDVYAQPIAIWSGPVLRAARRDGETMVLTFDHASGLAAKSGGLRGFAIAGADREFVWADARIEHGEVVVSSAAVKAPAAVRYSWATNPIGNLVNAGGLPASPCRTDEW